MPNNHFFSSYGLSEPAPVSITAYDDSPENILHTVGKLDSQGIGEFLVQGFNFMTGYYKLRAELFARIAKYKIPARFFVYDKFSLSGSGKIDSVFFLGGRLQKN